MIRKILSAIVVVALIFLPVWAGMILVKFSPYNKDNILWLYSIVWAVFTIIAGLAGWLIADKAMPRQFFIGAFILFLIVTSMAGVFGLGAAPDFGEVMIAHPEREHTRFVFLFISAILFAAGIFLILKNRWNSIAKWIRLILLFLLIPAIAEIFWEFSHQYAAPEKIRIWVGQGKNAADFSKHYFSSAVANTGLLGRICQYTFIALFGLLLVKWGRMKKWTYAIIVFFCCWGLVSSITLFVTALHPPKGWEFLFIFFIPAGPLMLLCWTGLAAMTTKPSSKIKQQV